MGPKLRELALWWDHATWGQPFDHPCILKVPEMPEVRVREWLPYNSYDVPDVVEAREISWSVPTLQRWVTRVSTDSILLIEHGALQQFYDSGQRGPSIKPILSN